VVLQQKEGWDKDLKVITVASGKGGVGKTTLVANIGIALAESGNRVVLFDGDLGLANLDVVLGVKSGVRVQHVIDGSASLKDAMVEGPAGVKVISGDSGLGKMIRLSRKRLETMLEQAKELAPITDFLIFDASAGADAKVITFARAADEVVLIVTPDPASIVDAYATAKVLFRSKPDARVWVVVNMVESKEQAQKVYRALQSAVKEFVGKPVHFGGSVSFDTRVSSCNRSKSPFALKAPDSQVSRELRTVACMISTTSISKLPQMLDIEKAA
jgi:flagellar biosynthesis protein FlhG